MELLRSWRVKTILNTKDNAGGIKVPDLKIYSNLTFLSNKILTTILIKKLYGTGTKNK